MTWALDIWAEQHPESIVVQQEDLCNDPIGAFRSLFERLNVPFGPEVAVTFAESDQPASG